MTRTMLAMLVVLGNAGKALTLAEVAQGARLGGATAAEKRQLLWDTLDEAASLGFVMTTKLGVHPAVMLTDAGLMAALES